MNPNTHNQPPQAFVEKHTLWNEGRNLTSDAIVIRENEGKTEILLILRKNGKWALLGGFRDKKEGGEELETGLEGALREAQEEGKIDLSSFEPVPVYEGIVDDERNEGVPGEEGSRWIETEAFLFDVTGHELNPVAGSDALDVQWFEVTPELLDSLHASHGKIVQEALIKSGYDL